MEIEGDLAMNSLWRTGIALSAVSRHIASLAEVILIGIKPEFNTNTSVFSILFPFSGWQFARAHTNKAAFLRQ